MPPRDNPATVPLEGNAVPLQFVNYQKSALEVPHWSPMRQFVCKLASRCNLDCDYCYIYRHVDQTWREQPHFMSLEVAAQLGRRIEEHARKHSLRGVDVTIHGGEPLLAGADYLTQWMDTVSAECLSTPIQYQMQTNGSFFDERILNLCVERNVRVGLSMDGPRAANDRHRVGFDGSTSFDATERAARLLASPIGQRVWSGFLAVIDLESNPLDVYRYFRQFKPRAVEFLLPLCNHDRLPPRKIPGDPLNTPYADWLLAIFHEWFLERPQTISIRRFRDVIALMGKARSASEEWGLHPIDFAVVETNGSIEAVDTLKTTYSGASYLGMSVFSHSFDDVLSSRMVLERQQRWARLSPTCQRCSLVEVCGGGYFPHRYSEANGFLNPSVYCADLQKMIREIHAAVVDLIDEARRQRDSDASQPQ